jgi:hypothetical protein
MTRMPKKGDKVRWRTPQGETEGTVERIITDETHVRGHTARATAEHKEILVKSERSGKEAIHRPEALKKA